MAKINTTKQLPKVVLHNGDTITLEELALEMQKEIGNGNPLFIGKGDLAVGQGVANLAARLAVGANGTFLKADSTEPFGLIWSVPGGSGDVVGPASSVDDHIVLFNGTSGKAIKSSIKTIAEIFADHVALADPHSQYALDTDLTGKQDLDTLLTDISSLSYAGNGLKVLRVNAGATAFELATLSGGGDLLAANNLSDLLSAATARTNLGLGALAVLASISATEIDADAVTTVKILNSNVTLAKIQNIATSRFLGRITAASGVVEELTAAQAKTILSLVKADVGLGNVDNTSDANKPVSTAQQSALDGKQDLDALLTDISALAYATNASKVLRVNVGATAFELHSLVKADVGLGNVDNTTDLAKPISTATQTALDAKVAGPASAVDDRIAVFDGVTGKLIKDGGQLISALQIQDALLDSIALLAFAGNGLKHLRVNAGATAFELVSHVNETITLTGDVTGSGTASFAATISNNAVTTLKILDEAVTLAKLQHITSKRILGRTSASVGDVEELTAAQVKSDLALNNVDNTADVNKSVLNATEWNGAVKTVGTGAPTGGSDGDIHFQHQA